MNTFRIRSVVATVTALFLCNFLIGQTEWNETQKRIDNRVKTITRYMCYTEFNKSDSCVVVDISTYDSTGRLIKSESNPQEEYRSISVYEYNKDGKRIRYQSIHKQDTITTLDEYDKTGKKVKTVSLKNGIQSSSTENTYNGPNWISSVTRNERGEIVSESQSSYNEKNVRYKSVWTIVSQGQRITTYYNNEGQPTSDTIRNNVGEIVSFTTYLYRNDTIAFKRTTKPNGVTEIRFEYDSLKRISSIQTSDSAYSLKTSTVQYSYNSDGSLNDIVTTNLQSIDTTRHEYDNKGRLIQKRHSRYTPEKTITRYIYSEKEQPILITYIRHVKDSMFVANEYNQKGQKSSTTTRQGKIIQSSHYSFDSAGSIVNEKRYVGLHPDSLLFYYEIEYRNDGEGKHIEATHKDYTLRNVLARTSPAYNTTPPTTFTMVYAYDNRDSLVSVTGVPGKGNQRVGEESVKYAYGAKGKLQTVEYYYPGTERVKNKIGYEYDDQGNLICMKRYLDSGNVPYLVFRYYYDTNGRLIHTCEYSKWNKLLSHTVSLYDERGQLINVIDVGTGSTYQKFTYETY